MTEYRFVVAVECESFEEAETVMCARIQPDEDYGFAYTIDWATVDPAVWAAIGHAICFTVEDNSGDPILIDPILADAARRFYATAQELAKIRPNVEEDT